MNRESVFLIMRRSYVQAIIQLANAHQGGNLSLISVHEHDDHTDLEFLLGHAIKESPPYPLPADYKSMVVRRIICTLQLVPEDGD